MSIKRHPALQPFSRDHLIGLYHAQRLMKLKEKDDAAVIAATVAEFIEAWKREISVHFDDEDRIFAGLPISSGSLERLDAEHEELRHLMQSFLTTDDHLSIAEELGKFLDSHIRWEEHELFFEIEGALGEGGLRELAKETDVIEKSRSRKLL
jgi:hemerythrin